jgi:hypothetical protein
VRFVHLAPASAERAIERSGIAGAKAALLTEAGHALALRRAVFAMPVVADFWTTLQWLRELRRGRDERMVAVHFRIPDDEPVHVGRYNGAHRLMQAAATAEWVIGNPAGAQVVVPRSVGSREIVGIRQLTQLVGWTQVPENERKSGCICPVCLPKGSRDLMRRVRAAYASAAQALHRASSDEEATAAIRDMEMPLERARGRIAPGRLSSACRSPSARVRRAAASVLRFFKAPDVEAPLSALLGDEDPAVRGEALESLMRVLGVERTARRLDRAATETLVKFLDLLRYESDDASVRSILARFVEHPSDAVRLSAAKTSTAMDAKRR